MDELNTRLITAYWCNRVSGDIEDRFRWANKAVDEKVEDLDKSAHITLVALAKSAPDDYCAAYFAAGPLEDYINRIVGQQDPDEAAFIVNNIYLKNLLHLVWGDVKHLKPLAELSRKPNEPEDFNAELECLDLKEIMSFWCHTCVPSLVTDYEIPYMGVIKKLHNKKKYNDVSHDLLLTAPDEKSVEFLKDNILTTVD